MKPIVYFTTSTLSERPSSPSDRRPEHIMLGCDSEMQDLKIDDSRGKGARDQFSRQHCVVALADPA